MQKLKISSQSLLELTILGCSIEHLDISATSLQTIDLSFDIIITSTNVYAPNLLCFYWYHNLCENLNFVENPSLLHTLGLRLGEDNLIRLDNLRNLRLVQGLEEFELHEEQVSASRARQRWYLSLNKPPLECS
ncbi:hypothetical protein ACFE04_008586 [Oxalis oulophora]